MPDSCGTVRHYGALDSVWGKIKASNVGYMRYGGNNADAEKPNLVQYLKIVDSVRARGMEPILQVPYHNGLSGFDSAWARQVVRYINVTKGRAVKNWIIGNEPDLNYSPIYASRIAYYLKMFSFAMKNEDPSIKIIGPEISRIKMEDGSDPNQKIVDSLTIKAGTALITGNIGVGKRMVNHT